MPQSSISRKQIKKAIAGARKEGSTVPLSRNRIPASVLEDPALNDAIATLPKNYSFEIHKTIHQIRSTQAKSVALQMPEGLLLFACTIADIIERFTDATTVIMGDVTYGACCIDDYTALALACDMLIHYGHSCLVPIDSTRIKTLYIFVEISIDSVHLAQTIRKNFPDTREAFHRSLLDNEVEFGKIPPGSVIRLRHLQISDSNSNGVQALERAGDAANTRLALVSTIQFATALNELKDALSMPQHRHPQEDFEGYGADVLHDGIYDVMVPRSKPLSPGEILGCTAPHLEGVEAIVYLGDGRFHLESIMIANPSIPAFRYDPYSKKVTRERYDHSQMRSIRREEIEKAAASMRSSEKDSSTWGLVLGTLGRQGSTAQMKAIQNQAQISQPNLSIVPILLSELSPAKLRLFGTHLSTFIQTSCPRLSIDWGYAFDRPLLSPYEATVALGSQTGWKEDGDWEYPMDFYAAASPWSLARSRGYF